MQALPGHRRRAADSLRTAPSRSPATDQCMNYSMFSDHGVPRSITGFGAASRLIAGISGPSPYQMPEATQTPTSLPWHRSHHHEGKGTGVTRNEDSRRRVDGLTSRMCPVQARWSYEVHSDSHIRCVPGSPPPEPSTPTVALPTKRTEPELQLKATSRFSIYWEARRCNVAEKFDQTCQKRQRPGSRRHQAMAGSRWLTASARSGPRAWDPDMDATERTKSKTADCRVQESHGQSGLNAHPSA